MYGANRRFLPEHVRYILTSSLIRGHDGDPWVSAAGMLEYFPAQKMNTSDNRTFQMSSREIPGKDFGAIAGKIYQIAPDIYCLQGATAGAL